MKITYIYPRFEKFLSNTGFDADLVDYFLGDFTTPPSLGIPIMASLTPPDVEIELIDDNSGDEIDYNAPTDLVAINCFTPQATRAFEIADQYRTHGKKVIMGGIFPSFMVDDCLKHADSVNTGEVEPTWQTIIEDVKRGELKPEYRGGCKFDLSKMKIPRRDIFYNKKSYTWEEDLVQITRGCLYDCAMCAIPAHMGYRIRFRPIDQVIEEIKSLKYENVYLADDVFFFPQRKIVDYSTELFRRLIPLQKKYFVSSTLALNTDREFLDLAAKAGVCNFYCTMNVDPVSIKAIQGGKKEQQALIDLVKNLEDRGIRFFGSFAIGRDWDDTGIADRILELYTKANIHTSEFFLFTPYPGTKHWERLNRQNRVFDKDWSHYNGAHVVAKHPKMSVDELNGQFIKIWKDFFDVKKHRHIGALEPLTYKEGRETVGIPLQQKGVQGQAAITGIGIFSPIGNDPETVLSALQEGKCGLAPTTKFDASSFRTDISGEVKNFHPEDYLSEAELAECDDAYILYAIAAARNAIKDSGLKFDQKEIKRNIALVLGTCNGGLLSAEDEYKWKHNKSDRIFDEKMNLQAQYYGFGKAIAGVFGIGGDVWVVTTACSATTGAIGLAQMLINRGYYDTVLVGGSDSLCVANMAGFDGLKATSTSQIAPFSQPYGLNIGEAACFWVIEEMEKAILRHAKCYGKIIGHSTTSDAYHPTAPDPGGDGIFRTLHNAMIDSQIELSEIGCVNAHGTGTEANDRAETRGVAKLFGDNNVPVVSLKSFFGHCMGSSGILEATCNVLAMNSGFIPPTINFTEPRPGCTLDYVPNKPRQKEYNAFISANYAFGGNNAAVVITKRDYSTTPQRKKDKRVVVTGTGTVTSLGIGTEKNVFALKDRGRGLSLITELNLKNMKSELAGLVPDFKATEIDRRLDFSGLNKISRMAVSASHLALEDAGLRIGRKNAADFGIVMGVCNGPCESGHMDAVFSTDTFGSDINSFANITANTTAGWVSKVLSIKGVNMTLSPGHHAGLQSLGYAYDFLSDGRSKNILVSASDEVYAQTYFNYNLMDFLYQGEEESSYKLHFDSNRRKVLGEGAATLIAETMESAKERGARIFAEVLGYGMSMDAGPFTEQNLDPEGLEHACNLALTRSKIGPDAIDLVIWAPQGNIQDKKVIDSLQKILGARYSEVPFVTTTFNTGYIESASILVTLAAALESLQEGNELWPQMTGVAELDERKLQNPPGHVIALGSSDVGYNFAVVLKNGRLL